jgi:hypothetical protein
MGLLRRRGPSIADEQKVISSRFGMVVPSKDGDVEE